jgi:hypothetical protein
MKTQKVPIKYVPKRLTAADKKRQINALRMSKRMYKKREYYTRKRVKSFKSKTSNHVLNARKIYRVDHVRPDEELSRKTGCSVSALKQIVRKGEGAYYSSGSRPNQTAQSWGIARLASAITAGKAASVDYGIIENGCDHKKTAFILANKSRKKYGDGHSSTPKISI